MFKKVFLIGLLLCAAGAAGFNWVWGEKAKEKQLLTAQHAKLRADLASVDRLVAGESELASASKMAPNPVVSAELDKHLAGSEARELVVTFSILCFAIGGPVVGISLAIWTGRLLGKAADSVKGTGHEEQSQVAVEAKKAKKRSKILAKCGWQSFRRHSGRPASELIGSQTTDKSVISGSNRDAERLAVVMRNEETFRSCASRFAQDAKRLAVVMSNETVVEAGETLQAHSDTVDCEITELNKLAQNIQKTVVSEPLKDGLKELTEQVSAIREYASGQQDRIKKLQDGYDWNITRTFCLRVIRCIDNLEGRIERLSAKSIDTADLEEVKDELVFALESSGVEQFKPAINSDYRGQEKSVEAVKAKEACDQGELRGKIAKVIRAGYRYVIDEENLKVVRTAQVKLFG